MADQRTRRFGLILPVGEWRMDGVTARWADLQSMSLAAEDVGFDAIWVVDHLLSRSPDGTVSGVWEGWSLIAALAAVTRQVEIGSLVLCNGFREPALLAKMADTVDEISGGRLVLGLGAGHHEPEFRAFGFPFDHRVSRFEEAIQIVHGLLRNGRMDFRGDYYDVRDCELRPRGPREQGPPIMIGTTGPRMLALTARYADHWNVYFDKIENSPAGLEPLMRQVDAACAAVGRDPTTLGRSVSLLVALDSETEIRGVNVIPMNGSLEQLAIQFEEFFALGIDQIQIRVEPNTRASVEALAPLIGRFK